MAQTPQRTCVCLSGRPRFPVEPEPLWLLGAPASPGDTEAWCGSSRESCVSLVGRFLGETLMSRTLGSPAPCLHESASLCDTVCAGSDPGRAVVPLREWDEGERNRKCPQCAAGTLPAGLQVCPRVIGASFWDTLGGEGQLLPLKLQDGQWEAGLGATGREPAAGAAQCARLALGEEWRGRQPLYRPATPCPPGSSA